MEHQYLYLDRILYPVTSLGPGRRAAIWMAGCPHHCFRCANPELWERNENQKMDLDKAIFLLSQFCINKKPDGLTITGGEPFEQAGELKVLLDALRQWVPDILIYSGYTFTELQKKEINRELLKQVDVLTDGPYRDELNKPSVVLRGSENQKILYLNKDFKESYECYMKNGRQIQNFVYDYRILSVGIHSRDESQEEPFSSKDLGEEK